MKKVEIQGEIPEKTVRKYNTIIDEMIDAAFNYTEAFRDRIDEFFDKHTGKNLREFVRHLQKKLRIRPSRELLNELIMVAPMKMNPEGQIDFTGNFKAKKLFLYLLAYVTPPRRTYSIVFKDKNSTEAYKVQRNKVIKEDNKKYENH